jgi:hypothetical protein
MNNSTQIMSMHASICMLIFVILICTRLPIPSHTSCTLAPYLSTVLLIAAIIPLDKLFELNACDTILVQDFFGIEVTGLCSCSEVVNTGAFVTACCSYAVVAKMLLSMLPSRLACESMYTSIDVDLRLITSEFDRS